MDIQTVPEMPTQINREEQKSKTGTIQPQNQLQS